MPLGNVELSSEKTSNSEKTSVRLWLKVLPDSINGIDASIFAIWTDLLYKCL